MIVPHFIGSIAAALILSEPPAPVADLQQPPAARAAADADPGAIFAAIARRRPEVVRRVLEQGADLTVIDSHGRTPLQVACQLARADLAEILLDHGADPDNAGDNPGYGLPLMMAIGLRNTPLVKLLLDRGASIPFGIHEPFGPAFYSREPEIPRLLIDAMFARGQQEMRRHGNDVRMIDQALIAAAMVGDLEWPRKLLDAGADVNAISQGQYTPLIGAVLGRNLELVELLLARGADPRFDPGNRGSTALRMSIGGQRNIEIFKRIIAALGENPEEIRTPMHTRGPILLDAIHNKNPEAAALLLQHGADPHVRINGRDLLLPAISSGVPALVELLLRHDVHVGQVMPEDTWMTHERAAQMSLEREDTPERRRILELIQQASQR